MPYVKSKHEIGQLGEKHVRDKLVREGFEILGTNVRVGMLEMDIVAQKNNMLVVCEVRTKNHSSWLHPAETITEQKKKRVRQAAIQWLSNAPQKGKSIRFDVAAVVIKNTHSTSNVEIDYYENAF